MLVYSCLVPLLAGVSARAAPVPVASNGRVLLVTSSFVTHGQPKLKWLYRFLELSSVYLAKKALSSSYGKIYLLGGKHATGKNFVESFSVLAKNPAYRAIDVMVHLHGTPKALVFEDGDYSPHLLGSQITSLALRGKARLFYSSACYGALHAPEFVDAGFQAASGSLGVNADSAYSYPAILAGWRANDPYFKVVQKANLRASIWVSDRAARLMGFDDVNSLKRVSGDGMAQIGHLAPF